MSYLTQHFKGKYRIVPELSPESHDVPREEDGTVDKSYDDLYIKCQFGNKIYYYGRGTFVAYIPSIGRGKNIIKKLDETNIPYSDPHIYDDNAYPYRSVRGTSLEESARTLTEVSSPPHEWKSLPSLYGMHIPSHHKYLQYQTS